MLGFKNEFFEVIEFAGTNERSRLKLWKCQCKCGNTTIVDSSSLKHNRKKSCGCARKGKNKGNVFGFRHGMYINVDDEKLKINKTLLKIRNSIITRCYNAKKSDFPYYQGRGIKVCDEWIIYPRLFIEWALANGWKKGLSLDRIDPDKDYEPNNCQFITMSQNLVKMHQQNKYRKEPKQYDVVSYCFRCKCTAPEDSSCKLVRKDSIQYKRH